MVRTELRGSSAAARAAWRMSRASLLALFGSLVLAAGSYAQALTPRAVVDKLLESDPFGMSDATVSAHLILKAKDGSPKQLAFKSQSKRYDPPFAKSLVRFTAPADLAGAGFLQVQKRDADDDRFLFLPELRRSRRISGSLRTGSFMGTDFSFADLDRRDLRESEVAQKPDETVGKYPCHVVEVKPKRDDSPYARMAVWVRKDNFLPLKMLMYDRSNVLVKTFTAREVQRLNGRWFITKSLMVNNQQGHSTELNLDNVSPATNLSDEDFTVRNLEKL